MRTENDGIIEESGDDIGEHRKSCRSGAGDREDVPDP